MQQNHIFYCTIISIEFDIMTPLQIYTIGRAPDNSLVTDPKHGSVSKYHAAITFVTDHIVLLQDKGSTYGTIVDGRKVEQTIIGPDNNIILGQTYQLDYPRILALRNLRNTSIKITKQALQPDSKIDPLDFKQEFKQLSKIQEVYLEAREVIQLNSPRQQGRLRAALALIPVAGMALGPFGILAGAGISAVSQILAAEFLNPSQKLIALDKEFKRNYVCPNPECNRPLGNTPYIDLLTRKQCPTCKAKWAD